MAFFEDLTKKTKDLAYVAADKAKDVAAVAADKAKDAAELTRISMAIAGEQREIDKNYRTIGEWFVSEYEGEIPDAVRDLVEAVADQQPDLIAISGDLADERTDRTTLPPLLTSLTNIAPTYFVTGNHEWVRDDTEDLLKEFAALGVTVLRNDYVLLERDGQTIVLAGADDPNAYRDMDTPADLLTRIRAEVPGDPYTVLLYHRNNSLSLWSSLQPDLVLAGHGHGGVIRLPLVGGLLGVDRQLFPKDCEGLYTTGRTTLAVSRGLGGVRLFTRPHLPTLVLKRAQP